MDVHKTSHSKTVKVYKNINTTYWTVTLPKPQEIRKQDQKQIFLSKLICNFQNSQLCDVTVILKCSEDQWMWYIRVV